MSDERTVEVPFAVANTIGPVLDVGHAESRYLHQLDGPVDGIDVRAHQHPALRHSYQADIRTWQAPQQYRTVLAVSTLEHVGLEFAPYGTSADDPDGDRHAVEGCMRAVEPGGQCLITLPYGEAADHGWYRSYGQDRLERLLDGWDWSAEYVMNDAWAVKGVALIKVNKPVSP